MLPRGCVYPPVDRHFVVSSQPSTAQVGSLEIFWPLIEPILTAFKPRSLCEIGVAAGALTEHLLAWAGERGCAYVGIDPAPGGQIKERLGAATDPARQRLLLQTSLAALPGLGRCDVYFLDGDHNYFTVAGELRLIAAAHARELEAGGPIIFLHDVGWPWGRRDMYYLPTTVPAEERHPWSETLGTPLEGDELIEGGLREPGRYAIALRPGGPRNGVLTAVEDFLRSDDGAGWESTVLPAAYGLAVLHRTVDPALPAACRDRLEELREVAGTAGAFLRAYEQNFLRLYLFGQYHRHAAFAESIAHQATLKAYDDLLALQRELGRVYDDLLTHDREIEHAYEDLLNHDRKIGRAYEDLLQHDREIGQAYQDLLAHSRELEGEYKSLLASYEQLRERAASSASSPQTAPAQDHFAE